MSDHESREELCPACLTFPGEHDERVIWSRQDEATGRYVVTTTWHKDGCPNALPGGTSTA